MKILGIETSCDETAASVVEDGHRILSNVVNSQIDIHAIYGGVVPEVAARSHIEVINPVINKALSDANLSWDDIGAIAVTYAPGLIGSLLVGTLAARTLAIVKNKPLYPVHHIKSHVYANFLTETAPEFPMLALIVSGGHSQLMLFRGHNDFEILGQTQDDAIGEAFDKVAKILGLPYPGGPSIANAALNGDKNAYKLPKAKVDGRYDFSFSGLKTAVLRAVQREANVDISYPSSGLAELLSDAQRNNFAASFQNVAAETLAEKSLLAFNDFQPKSFVIAGGVAANQELRRILSEKLPIAINFPPIGLCTDNAAMVASLGYFEAQTKSPVSPYDVDVMPSLSMSKDRL
jgi:N6-L-threonylcarbamoyladenine synthase